MNSAELFEAINSMFEWYKNAQVCYDFLADVPTGQIVLQHYGMLFMVSDKPVMDKGIDPAGVTCTTYCHTL
jgi:hypothetical protein